MFTHNTLQDSPTLRVGLALSLGLALLVGLLLAMGAVRPPEAALAQGRPIRYVAPAPIGIDTDNDCKDSAAPCATLQHAVDVAGPGDEIRVATGVYTDVHVRPRNDVETTGVVTQVVYISKTVTIRGGYTSAFAQPPDPVANPTTLDAWEQGRVLYITGDISPTVEGLRIANGDASGLGGQPPGDADAGGGVYAITATVTMSASQVFSNFAIIGGGLFFLESPNLTLISNTISNNRAGPLQGGVGYGGGARFENCIEPMLSNNVVDDNGATNGGGLSFYKSPTATLTNNTVKDNVAMHIGGWVKNHAGVEFVNSDNATLKGNVISGNSSHNNCGGACFLTSDNAVLINNSIISNTARLPGFAGNGAGLYFYRSKNASLRSNTIAYNTGIGDINSGTIFGAGLFIDLGSSAALTANTVISNTATKGGGIGAYRESELTLTGNTVLSNSAVQDGGGLYLLDSSAQLDNNIVARNSAPLGGGIHLTGTATLAGWHNTLVGASGEGLRLSGPDNSAALTNTIFTTFTTGVNAQAGTVTLERTLWFGNETNTSGVTPTDGNDPVYGDPVFINPAADNYHITITVASAARDQGVPGGPDQDIDGGERPGCGSMPDIGADETSCCYLPVAVKM